MKPESTSEMQAAMHQLAEHVLRFPAKGNRSKWLQRQIADLLTTNDTVLYYAQSYSDEYPYADIQNPYLSQLTQNYDKN